MPTEAQPDLERTVHAWADAIVSNDPARIETFITDDWVLVTPEAGVVSRESFIDAVATGRLTHTWMTHQILRSAVYDTVAVVTTRGRNAATFLGEPITADEWTTEVFHFDGQHWRCSLTQLTPVTQPAEAQP